MGAACFEVVGFIGLRGPCKWHDVGSLWQGIERAVDRVLGEQPPGRVARWAR